MSKPMLPDPCPFVTARQKALSTRSEQKNFNVCLIFQTSGALQIQMNCMRVERNGLFGVTK